MRASIRDGFDRFWAYVSHRQVMTSVYVLVAVLVVGTAAYGPSFIAMQLPVPHALANIWLACNGILCVVAAFCCYRNMHRYEAKMTWQEVVFYRGVCWFLIAASVGYLSRIVTTAGTVSWGTPGTTLGVCAIIYASVGPPTRFEVEDELTREQGGDH